MSFHDVSFCNTEYCHYDAIYVLRHLTFTSSCPGKGRTGWSAGIIFERAILQKQQLPSPFDLGKSMHNQHFTYYQAEYQRLVFTAELVFG